jgi:hypothetical protein
MAIDRRKVKNLKAMLAARPEGSTEGLDLETSAALVDQLLACMEALDAFTSREADAKTQKRRQDVGRAVNKPL